MNIIKSTDSITVNHPVFLLFGQPGICKTSLGYSAKDPLLADADVGAHRAVNRRDTIAINSWNDLAELADPKAKDTIAPYATIVPDTIGRVLDHLAVHLIGENPKFDAGGGNLTLKGYGALKGRFTNWLTAIRALGKDVVLLAHGKEDRDGDSLIIRPDVTGGSYAEIMKVADFVGFIYMRGKDRVLDFSPSDRWVGKNPAQWKPIVIPPPEKATTLVADLMVKGREALGNISAESAAIAELVQGYREHLATVTTPGECSGVLTEIEKKALSPVALAQVKQLLLGRSKELKFTFNKTTRLFEDPNAVEVPVDISPAEQELGF